MMATLQANRERMRKGRMPDQSVRGIGAEKLVEEIEVRDVDGRSVLGSVQVFHVSAQFPKPTTPRDFVALILSWDTRVEDARDGGGRYWMMVSKPCVHPDVPSENGYIRGEYESVEFIREIPVRARRGVAAQDAARSEEALVMRGAAGGSEAEGKAAEEEMNPVEWIMVTRSDPGGNIPRWMVEKGTPKSICSDAVKFLDWACREPSSSGPRSTKARRRSSVRPERSGQPDAGIGDTVGEETSDSDLTDTEVEHHGLIASFSYLVNAGLERYAPQAVLDYLPGHSRQSSRSISDYHSSVKEEDTPRTSADSAPTTPRSPVDRLKQNEDDGGSASTHDRAPGSPSKVSSAIEGGPPDIAPMEMMKMNKKGKLSSHEKHLAKLAERKRDVESQLDKVRGDIQSLQLPAQDEESRRAKASAAALTAADPSNDQVSSSAASSMHGPASDDRSPRRRGPHREASTAKLHKVASGLFQDESKLLKQLEKIEKNQFKEASKIEARQQKHADREEKSRSHSENEFLRREVEVLKKEIGRLRSERQQWLNLVGSLQAENAKLVARNADT
ncbi:hypothetical protein BDV59DRAFT_171105, partial [Aspergillus ambiguus]|uniref:uncharacterized protein n=1 Tax=Aspergillus ambiguus TaxID=176160 RepID=UPI003CCDE4D9